MKTIENAAAVWAIKALRSKCHMGMFQAKRSLELYLNGTCPDLLQAALYVDSSELAIHVKGGPDARHLWNLNKAKERAADFLARNPELRVIVDFDGTIPDVAPSP